MSLLGGLTTLAKNVSKALNNKNNVNKPTPQKSSGSSNNQTSYKAPISNPAYQPAKTGSNKPITTSDNRVVNRATKQTSYDDLKNYDSKNIRGWNDKSVSNLNLSYLPKGLTLPADGKFDVGAYTVTRADGDVAQRDANGNPIWEYRPTIYYDRNGNPTFSPQNNVQITKGGKKSTSNGYSYDEKDVYGYETPLYEVLSPSTGKWTTMGMSQALGTFRNLVEGGYATEADMNKYLRNTGKLSRGTDYANGLNASYNTENKNAMNNQMYNDDPQGALKFRAQQQDDAMRYEHYKKTGENLPVNYFFNKIMEEQQAVQKRVQGFQQQNSGIADASQPGTQMTAMAQNVAKAMNPQAAQAPRGQFSYQNFDINGNLIGTTYGESGKSNALPGASYVKAPNGQIYQTSNFGSTGARPQVNNQVMGTGMQAPAVSADLNGGFYMNPQDYMIKSNDKAIETQYDSMQRAMQMQNRNALEQTLSDIDYARQGLSAQYDPAKNDLYTQGRLNQQGISEYMGSLGMEGGQNITAQARNNNSTQQAIATVEAQKQAQDGVLQKAAIDAQRASSMEELAQSYQVNAQKIQAILQDAQYTNMANMQAMKDAFTFNYQARADELARQDANRNFFYNASRDSRNDFMTQQQMEYEKILNDRDFQFKQDQFDWNKSTWQKEFGLDQARFNLSAQKKSSSKSSSGGSSSSKSVDTNTLKASIYNTIDSKLGMVPMGSGGKPQYPGQFNTKAAQKWLDENRNTIIQDLGETAYKTYQTYINKKPSVGS